MIPIMLQRTEAHLIITQRTNLLVSSPKHQNICYKLHLLYIFQLKKKKTGKKNHYFQKEIHIIINSKKIIAKILFSICIYIKFNI